MLYYKLRHSQSSECLNLRKKTRKSVWYNDHYLKGPGTIIFKKRFPKPDYKRKVISIIFPWFFFFFSSLPYLFFLADLLTKSFPLLTKQFINLVPLSIREGVYIYIYIYICTKFIRLWKSMFTKIKFSCYNAIKTSFLALVIPVPFLF